MKLLLTLALLLATAGLASAQDMPADYKAIIESLGRPGDFKDGVLKVNIPRSDLKVTVAGVPTPTPFGFGGWIALTKGDGAMQVLMGDLVLTQDEVNPVMSAVLAQGLDVTALHNHFFWESPRMFYMHVHGHGAGADLATRIKPALDLIGKVAVRQEAPGTLTSTVSAGAIDTAKLAGIIGTPGEQNGQVYKITVGRPDITLKEMGATINARMGLNTWAAFFGSDAAAVVAGDVAMLDTEVTPVLKALRANGLEVVAIHHHMTNTQPTVVFLHYWGQGPAEKLATGVRAAINETGPKRASGQARAMPTAATPAIVFVCEHGAAKSLIATAYFNKLAAERGLPYRAQFRGTDPQEALSVRAVAGLKADGMTIPAGAPTAIGAGDIAKATHIFAIGCTLPAAAASSGKAKDWSDVPDDSYEAQRAAIVRHVKELLEELQRRGQ